MHRCPDTHRQQEGGQDLGGERHLRFVTNPDCTLNVANVVLTGRLTIPMMKDRGFRPNMAGAIEAAASTGGQLMPPVMGAGAFILATWTNIPYLNVALAALIPENAILCNESVTSGFHVLPPTATAARDSAPRRPAA